MGPDAGERGTGGPWGKYRWTYAMPRWRRVEIGHQQTMIIALMPSPRPSPYGNPEWVALGQDEQRRRIAAAVARYEASLIDRQATDG